MANSHNTVQAALWTRHYSHVDNVAIVMTNVRWSELISDDEWHWAVFVCARDGVTGQ